MRKLTFIIITSVCVLIFAFSSPNPKNYVYIKELKEMTYNDNEYHLNKITLNNEQIGYIKDYYYKDYKILNY